MIAPPPQAARGRGVSNEDDEEFEQERDDELRWETACDGGWMGGYFLCTSDLCMCGCPYAGMVGMSESDVKRHNQGKQ